MVTKLERYEGTLADFWGSPNEVFRYQFNLL